MNSFNKCKFCTQYSSCLYLKRGEICDWNLVSANSQSSSNKHEYLSSNINIQKRNMAHRVDIVLEK